MVLLAEAYGYRQYVGSSVNGEAAIDWSDRQARRKLLAEIVADADRLSELAQQTLRNSQPTALSSSPDWIGRICEGNCCSTM